MKSTFSLFLLPLLLLNFFSDHRAKHETSPVKTDPLGCAPGLEVNDSTTDGKIMVALPGWGKHHFKISTTVDSAQFYFDQGLSMYYSYHAREANASFREAARLDPDCAMAYWGQALARGPAYNSAHRYIMPKELPAIIEKMNSKKATASQRERDLIEAMIARYSEDYSDQNRKSLNSAYSRQMQSLVSKYSDQDIAALYIDAVMLEHPWSFWNNDGTSKPWTPELIGLCETILKQNNKHPGAIHYYIHLTEASRTPERALPGADVLKDLLPGVAHMVHMSSHVYERNGSYEKGVEVNERADQNLVFYDSLVRDLKSVSLSRHVSHYFAVQTYCALSGGMYEKGMPLAIRVRNSVSPDHESNYSQYLYMMPVIMQVRLGKWKEIMNDDAQPASDWTYASLLYDFAKGMAHLNANDISTAKKYLQQLREKSQEKVLAKIDTPFNSPSQGAYIAEHTLDASILFKEKNYDAALNSLKQAIAMEDKLIYVEPKDWIIPARQFLGAYLVKLKRFKQAEKVYQEDLAWNPGNGWSLLGLHQSLTAQGEHGKAASYRDQYLKSFSAADEIPPASAYLP